MTMANAKSADKTPPLPSLPQRELDLVRSALDQVRRIPVNSPDDQAVVKMIRIRKDLERRVRIYDELREQARREVRWGLLISFASSALVLALGFWRILERSAMPLDVPVDPLKFLVLFTLLFLLAWSPFIVALIRRRLLRKRADEAPMGDAGPALKVFDVTLVRGLVQMKTGPKT
ncbi:MAG: hypothetical protein V2A56_06130 [bacterium]